MSSLISSTWRLALALNLGALPAPAFTNFISDQLPAGETLASLGLGERPFGPPERAVRLVEWSSVPAGEYCQQMAWQGDKVYCVLKEGQIIEYALDGTPGAQPFLDAAALLGADFIAQPGNSFGEGIRGFAFHPGYETNGLVYTTHRASGTGSPDLGFTSAIVREFIIAEWDMNDLQEGNPTFREVVRIGFREGVHRTNHIGFNPRAEPGDPDYGKLYCGIGDNSEDHSTGTTFDSHDVGQDFTSVLASVIRIDPLDPAGLPDAQLAAMGLKRSANGNYSIPLDNPFAGHPSFAEEIFAKGFRNPLTMNFAPDGRPMVGDVGQLSIEEINLLENGGNYGWGLREGTFIFTMADQSTGAFIGSDNSLRWVPLGDAGDPAVTYSVRNKDGTNFRMETIARSGGQADGLVYPVAQFSHEGNNTNGTPSGNSAVAGGQFYDGFWAEELTGIYLFGNFSMDTIFYIETSALVNDNQPAEVFRLPLIDDQGDPVTLASIIGNSRTNMRFGRDAWGNVYLVSKTNRKIYRFQGTPELRLEVETADFAGQQSALLSLTRPGPDPSLDYVLMGSSGLGGHLPVPGPDFELLPATPRGDGTETVQYRFLPSFLAEPAHFFHVKAEAAAGP